MIKVRDSLVKQDYLRREATNPCLALHASLLWNTLCLSIVKISLLNLVGDGYGLHIWRKGCNLTYKGELLSRSW